MTATLAASTAILKTRYPDGRLPKALYQRCKLVASVKKREDFTGNNRIVALQNENPQGSSADFTKAQANVAQGSYKAFTVTRVEHFGIVRIKGQALKAAEGDEGALVDLWKNECDGGSQTEMINHEIYMFGNGSGALGQISSGSTLASTTITLTQIADVAKFAIGMKVVAVSDTTLSPTVRSSGAEATITGVDRAAGTLTLGVNWSTAIAAVALGDYLVRSGDQASGGAATVLTGHQAWVVGGAAPGALFGMTRSTDAVRLAGQNYNATGVPFEEAVIEASSLVAQQGAKQPNMLWMHPRDLAGFKKQLGSKVQYPKVNVQSTVAGVSFKAIEIEGDEGSITVMTSPFAPRNEAHLLDMESFTLDTLGPAPHLQNYDKSDFLRVYNDDALEARFATYGQYYTNCPVGSIRITNFGA